MSNSAVRLGLRLMIFSLAASYILMRVRCIAGMETFSEHFYAAQTILLITAWIAGLITAGGFIFAPPRYKGICGVIAKLAAAALSVGIALLVVWAVTKFGGASACNIIFSENENGSIHFVPTRFDLFAILIFTFIRLINCYFQPDYPVFLRFKDF